MCRLRKVAGFRSIPRGHDERRGEIFPPRQSSVGRHDLLARRARCDSLVLLHGNGAGKTDLWTNVSQRRADKDAIAASRLEWPRLSRHWNHGRTYTDPNAATRGAERYSL